LGLPANDIAGKKEEQGKPVEVIELSSDDEDYSQGMARASLSRITTVIHRGSCSVAVETTREMGPYSSRDTGKRRSFPFTTGSFALPFLQLLGSRGILARRDASDLSFPSRLSQPVYRQRRHSGDLENTDRTSDGHLLVNAGKPPGDPEIFVAEHLADVLQPHQLGGVRFM
jgi:hypothetical protein